MSSDLVIGAYDDEIAADSEPLLRALRPPKMYVGRRATETAIPSLE
jgi:hypothetical protein